MSEANVTLAEFRVWTEASDLIGYATVTRKRGGWFTAEWLNEGGPNDGDASQAFRSESRAYDAAQHMAEEVASQHRAACQCGSEDCGVIHPHGISVQVCQGEDDVTSSWLG